jgi:hypothetical protein
MTTEGTGTKKAKKELTQEEREHVLQYHVQLMLENEGMQLTYAQDCGKASCTIPSKFTVTLVPELQPE